MTIQHPGALLRRAFLAAGLLAALTIPVKAQEVSDVNTEISFIGHVDVVSFSRGGTAPPLGATFNPRTDLPLQFNVYGFIEDGALFIPPAVETQFEGGVYGVRSALYTFSSALTLAGPPDILIDSFGNVTVVSNYVGIYEVWSDPDANSGPGDLQDYSEGSQSSFRDAAGSGPTPTRILYARIDILSSYTIPADPTKASRGVLDGTIVFDPTKGSGPINRFLIEHPEFLSGYFSNTGFSTAARVPGFSDFSTTGQIELIRTDTPEGNGATRTQGYFKNHQPAREAALAHCGPFQIGPFAIEEDCQAYDILWSNVAKLSSGAKRSALGQARIKLAHQLLTAQFNACLFGPAPNTNIQNLVGQANAALLDGDVALINSLQGLLDRYNNDGDNIDFPDGVGPFKNAKGVGCTPPDPNLSDTAFFQ